MPKLDPLHGGTDARTRRQGHCRGSVAGPASRVHGRPGIARASIPVAGCASRAPMNGFTGALAGVLRRRIRGDRRRHPDTPPTSLSDASNEEKAAYPRAVRPGDRTAPQYRHSGPGEGLRPPPGRFQRRTPLGSPGRSGAGQGAATQPPGLHRGGTAAGRAPARSIPARPDPGLPAPACRARNGAESCRCAEASRVLTARSGRPRSEFRQRRPLRGRVPGPPKYPEYPECADSRASRAASSVPTPR